MKKFLLNLFVRNIRVKAFIGCLISLLSWALSGVGLYYLPLALLFIAYFLFATWSSTEETSFDSVLQDWLAGSQPVSVRIKGCMLIFIFVLAVAAIILPVILILLLFSIMMWVGYLP
jgi:hypothetical protein